MQYFILAAAALLLAVIFWYRQAVGKDVPARAGGGEAAPAVQVSDRTLEALFGAIEALEAVMAHPELGGPGFLTLRFLPQGGVVAASAQYPNIREVLYRRAVRRELSREDLLGEGVPAALLELSPEFETESGGVVLVTVEVAAPELPGQWGLRERQAVLRTLSARIGERFPGLSVRSAGGELLLSPVRAAAGAEE